MLSSSPHPIFYTEIPGDWMALSKPRSWTWVPAGNIVQETYKKVVHSVSDIMSQSTKTELHDMEPSEMRRTLAWEFGDMSAWNHSISFDSSAIWTSWTIRSSCDKLSSIPIEISEISRTIEALNIQFSGNEMVCNIINDLQKRIEDLWGVLRIITNQYDAYIIETWVYFDSRKHAFLGEKYDIRLKNAFQATMREFVFALEKIEWQIKEMKEKCWSFSNVHSIESRNT